MIGNWHDAVVCLSVGYVRLQPGILWLNDRAYTTYSKRAWK